MRVASFLTATFLSLFLCTCGSAPDEESTTGDGENVMAQPGAFDAAAKALENDAPATEVRDLLIDNYAMVSDAKTGRIDQRNSQQFVDLADRFAKKVAGDTIAALPLYKSAEVYQALNDFPAAAAVFERIHKDYPSFSKSGEALFMLAFTYDENLKEFDKARAAYEQFIAQYPENTFADDAAMLIKNLGKSDEEILRALEQQQQ
ncbi:tol-pal system YbgF family protein [Lewinella sp. 4G2]|uniref:tetratricopeptide repeat protein n=1 Tax=Lewinella sp. 4G2 TaxID=1803372 RepID=UPI0007B4CBCB|nr:tetratricopeptide repeat protein [Lewinella sp. 4G2]OAV45488.1 hypothetical protein A3850_013760 [Lewinella sp. 4G2]